jgi:hypothetical protein
MDKDRTETKFKFSIIILPGFKFSGMGGIRSVLPVLDSDLQARNGPEKYPGGRVLDEVTVHGIFILKQQKSSRPGGIRAPGLFF